MSTLVVNRHRDGNNANPITIPFNPFAIQEQNKTIAIINVLKRDPLTESFSGALDVQNGVPTPDETTFDFVGFTLSAPQEADALSVINAHRDKNAFTNIDQNNIDYKQEFDDALEQLDQEFDEETIGELIVPDISAYRELQQTEYNSVGWSNLSVGEKRILIADWLIPTISERIEVFPGSVKREEIYKLFGLNTSKIKLLQYINTAKNAGINEEGDRLTKILRKELAPSTVIQEILVSRSNVASADANSVTVEIPVFSNVRENSGNLYTVLDNFQVQLNRDADLRIEFWATIGANAGTNHTIKGIRDRSSTETELDGNCKADGRGRDTSSFMRRAKFLEGDIIKFTLENANSGAGSLTAMNGKCFVEIIEIEYVE